MASAQAEAGRGDRTKITISDIIDRANGEFPRAQVYLQLKQQCKRVNMAFQTLIHANSVKGRG